MSSFFLFLKSKDFLKQLLYVILFLVFVLFAVMMWLRFYTNHGQKLTLPDYVGNTLEVAQKNAEDRTFHIIVSDSIYKVGKKGGVILSQTPVGGSKVKENRKIYVTVTKYNADKIKLGDLPVLYGNDYYQKSAELKYLEINTKIKSTKYDPGEPDYILEVWYKGRLIADGSVYKKETQIEKGSTLEFVISKSEGGEEVIPNLVCEEYNAAEFIALSSKFKIGQVKEQGEIKDRNTAYVVSQNPPADGKTTMPHNSEISIVIAQDLPANCH